MIKVSQKNNIAIITAENIKEKWKFILLSVIRTQLLTELYGYSVISVKINDLVSEDSTTPEVNNYFQLDLEESLEKIKKLNIHREGILTLNEEFFNSDRLEIRAKHFLGENDICYSDPEEVLFKFNEPLNSYDFQIEIKRNNFFYDKESNFKSEFKLNFDTEFNPIEKIEQSDYDESFELTVYLKNGYELSEQFEEILNKAIKDLGDYLSDVKYEEMNEAEFAKNKFSESLLEVMDLSKDVYNELKDRDINSIEDLTESLHELDEKMRQVLIIKLKEIGLEV